MTQPNAESTSAATSAASQSGAGGVVATVGDGSERAKLSAMMRAGGPDTSVISEPPPSAAHAEPETPPAPAADAQPGQETLPAGEPSPASEATIIPADDPGEPTSQTSDDDAPSGEPDETTPEISKDTQKRINKLTSEKYKLKGELEELKAKLVELESAQETATPPAGNGVPALPESVRKLKSVAQVEARADEVDGFIQQLTDFLDTNPGDARTVYDCTTGEAVSAEPDGKRFATRAQIISQRAAYREEAKALRRRGPQIVQETQFTQARQTAKARITADFPELNDPENADAKLARSFMAQGAFAGSVTQDYEALAFAVGHRVLQERLAERKNGKSNGNGKPANPFAKAANGRAGTSLPAAGAHGVTRPAAAPLVPPLKPAGQAEGSDVGSVVAMLRRGPQ